MFNHATLLNSLSFCHLKKFFTLIKIWGNGTREQQIVFLVINSHLISVCVCCLVVFTTHTHDHIALLVASLCMEFFRQEYWEWAAILLQESLNQGANPRFQALRWLFFFNYLSHQGSPHLIRTVFINLKYGKLFFMESSVKKGFIFKVSSVLCKMCPLRVNGHQYLKASKKANKYSSTISSRVSQTFVTRNHFQ